METDPRLSELLLRWQELQQQGQSITAAELCASCPELAAELQRRIETVDHWEQLLGTRDKEEAPGPGPVPASFGKYRVVRPLGDGGQASTLLAWDDDLHCHVVLKLYHNARTAAEQDKVLSEGRALARVRSPWVARCHGVERQDGVPALVVEYVPGRNLRQEQRARPLGIGPALELTAQLAEGLAAVHTSGLLHRDLKPDNVLIGDDGRPRLVDFGLAAALASDDLEGISGTLSYMAPEQARGEAERIDARTDVYGLGAVLYELLTGRPPHQGVDQEELWRAARAGDVVPPRQLEPRVPRAVNDLCLRCLARDPSQRFASAEELAGAVRCLQHWRRRLKRRWLLVTAALLPVCLLAGFLVPLLLHRAPHDTPRAPLSGELIVRVTSPGKGKKWMPVDQGGALPVRNGDRMQIEAAVNQPAHIYLLYLDSEGKVIPFYPWNDREKSKEEEPEIRDGLSDPMPQRPATDRVSSPRFKQWGWEMEGKSGLETVLLLVRRTPLPADVNLSELIGTQPRLPLADPLELALLNLDRGQTVERAQEDDRRGPRQKAQKIDDPLLELVARLQGHFEMIRAVRFAHQGD
jgi:serine/threonine protein kinase